MLEIPGAPPYYPHHQPMWRAGNDYNFTFFFFLTNEKKVCTQLKIKKTLTTLPDDFPFHGQAESSGVGSWAWMSSPEVINLLNRVTFLSNHTASYVAFKQQAAKLKFSKNKNYVFGFVTGSWPRALKLLEFPELQCLLSFKEPWEQTEVYANEVIQGESLVSEGLVTLGGVDPTAPPSKVKGGERVWK